MYAIGKVIGAYVVAIAGCGLLMATLAVDNYEKDPLSGIRWCAWACTLLMSLAFMILCHVCEQWQRRNNSSRSDKSDNT